MRTQIAVRRELFSRRWARKSGCGMRSWTRVGAGPRASLTATEIVSWATAEKSARLGNCPRQDVRWRRRSSSIELLAKRIRAWGSAESATDHRALGTSSDPRSLAQGWAGAAAERSQSGRTRQRCYLTGCRSTTSGAGAKSCWDGNHRCLHEKGWRKVNHRVIKPAPGNGHVLRTGGSTLRQNRAEHDRRRSRTGKTRQEDVPASPDLMR